MNKIFIAFFFLSSALMADVKSTTGQIKFDTQMDNQAEMTLNSTGLGIGLTPSTNLHVNGNAFITDQLFIGGDSGSSNLNINGTIGYSFESVTNSTTLGGNSIILADTSSGNIVLSLPEASSYDGRKYTIKKTSTLNSLFIRDGGFIDDYSDVTLSVNNMGSLSVISSAGNWHILNISGNGDLISSENLIGWWRFDDTSGTLANDDSLNGNDGTLNGGFTFSNNSLAAVTNLGLDFDGLDDEINFGEGNGLFDFGTGNFTCTMWVKTTGANDGNYYSLLEKKVGFNGTNPGFQWWLDYRQSGIITVRINDASATNDINAIATTNIEAQLTNDGNWHHIASIIELGNEVRHYFDGTPVGTIDISAYTNSINNDEPLTFNSDHKIGLSADDIRIYNKALTSAEIQALYNQGQ